MNINSVSLTTNPLPTSTPSPSFAAGKYQAEIMNAKYTFIQEEMYDHVMIEFRFLSGAYANQVVSKQYHLKSPRARRFLQNEFEKLGQPVDKREDLEPACAKIVGKKAFITIQYSPSGNSTIYIAHTVKPVNAVDPDAIWN